MIRRSVLAYLISGGALLTLYGVGGMSGWWKGFVRWSAPRSPSYDAVPGGYGPSSGGGRGGGYGVGGGSSGGGFRGGK